MTFPRGTGFGPTAYPQTHHGNVEGNLNQAGNDARHEHVADGLSGDDAIQHHDGAGRDEDAQRAPGGNAARGQGVGVFELPHFRYGDHAHGNGAGHGGTADGGETAAGRDGGDGQPAFQAAEPGVHTGEKFVADAGFEGKIAHEQKKTDNGISGVGEGFVGDAAKNAQGRVHAGNGGETSRAHGQHGDADGDAGENGGEEADNADTADGDGTHDFPPRRI